MDDAQTAALTRVLDQRFGVDVMWLFGSHATGRSTPSSDIDLAVLFRTRPSAAERIELESELSDILGKPVDLVDLDAASAAVAMQVLRHGRLLVDHNPCVASEPPSWRASRRVRELAAWEFRASFSA
jgi:predicted nucleotidyltransferase